MQSQTWAYLWHNCSKAKHMSVAMSVHNEPHYATLHLQLVSPREIPTAKASHLPLNAYM